MARNAGTIYELYYNIDGVDHLFYVGSTTCNWLSRRLTTHKDQFRRNPERALYRYIRQKGWSIENLQIRPIEKVDTGLLARERHWIETLKPPGNTNVPGRKFDEWYAGKKDEYTQIVKCEACGAEYQKRGMSNHVKTIKHKSHGLL